MWNVHWSTEACESAQIYGGSRDLSVVGGVLDDPVASQKSINQVMASVIQLQQEHKNHERKFLRTVRYGSK